MGLASTRRYACGRDGDIACALLPIPPNIRRAGLIRGRWGLKGSPHLPKTPCHGRGADCVSPRPRGFKSGDVVITRHSRNPNPTSDIGPGCHFRDEVVYCGISGSARSAIGQPWALRLPKGARFAGQADLRAAPLYDWGRGAPRGGNYVASICGTYGVAARILGGILDISEVRPGWRRNHQDRN